MVNLSFKEKVIIQLMRNKDAGLEPSSQAEIARKFGISKAYVGNILDKTQKGPKTNELRKRIASYVGIEN
ncbi:LexA family transcriptional regulator [Ligilactobacillus equi]|uniref:HTH cro/C1-type domain-containing protein n=1 Tax=Ligilactobacillus equi DPC 6820 TaxID=1392007 RepID=V7HWA0_9LACO|nr:MarR family transcriptional regulator [Ligilactobacillus equi]ETA73473.1 hypothetical protein LEQ_1845 [Ligilactobacillus equi DPC 6820]